MKKILSLSFLLTSILMFGQDSLGKKYTPYISAGLSMSNTNDFSNGSYPSLELGLSGKNISGGLIFGRNNFVGFGNKTDGIKNYYYELKSSISTPINKNVGIYGLFCVGAYSQFDKTFIEYGAGFSYSFGKLSYFVQSSNWDGVWYVTPGLTYNF